jgi:hypothetical protein
MNPVVLGADAQFAYKDAIFFSGHKFVGGIGKSVERKTICFMFHVIVIVICRQFGGSSMQAKYTPKPGRLPH